MERTFLIAALFLFGLTFILAAPTEERIVFITFGEKADVGVISAHGAEVVYQYDLLPNTLAIRVTDKSLQGILKNPRVVGYEEDGEVHLTRREKCSPWPSCKDDSVKEPAQPAQVLPWGIDRIDAEVQTGEGNGIIVCVVDTGIDRDHADLEANIIGGKNFIGKGRRIDSTKWDDDNGHGTHVSGTIAAIDNNIGVIGVAPQASLLVAKVLDRSGSGSISSVIGGIDYCVSAGADVISMSLGADAPNSNLKAAVDAAYAEGVLIIAAAGNDGSTVDWPAAYESVIAVSASDEQDELAWFSNYGSQIELSAPGINIFSTWNDGLYSTISGTSMSTPHVSGVAAIAIALNPTFAVEEIRTLLQNTADDLGTEGKDDFFGYGLVDAKLI